MNVITSYVPTNYTLIKDFDWTAIRQDDESGAIGYGATEYEAIMNLLKMEEER